MKNLSLLFSISLAVLAFAHVNEASASSYYQPYYYGGNYGYGNGSCHYYGSDGACYNYSTYNGYSNPYYYGGYGYDYGYQPRYTYKRSVSYHPYDVRTRNRRYYDSYRPYYGSSYQPYGNTYYGW